MKRIKYVVLVAGLLFFSVFGLVQPSFAEEDLYLEGIAYEPEKPSESMAVINGNLLKQGDQYQNYRVLEVKSNFVRLAKLDGSGERELRVIGGIHQPAQTRAPVQTEAKTAGEGNTNLGEDIQKVMTRNAANQLAMLERAKDTVAVADIRQLYVAGSVYFTEHENADPATLDKLIKSGMVSSVFQGGVKGAYRFTVTAASGGVTVNADPVDQNSRLRHFFIDEKGSLFSEENKPAASTSPLYAPQASH